MTCPAHPGLHDIDVSCADCRTVEELRAEFECHMDYSHLAAGLARRRSTAADRDRLRPWLDARLGHRGRKYMGDARA